MAESNLGIAVTGVQWKTQRSREKGGSGQEIRVGVRSMIAACKSCGQTWQATEGGRKGQFRQVIGSVLLSCPNCDTEAAIPTNNL